ncbi:IucA/IucC family siderophore biosynthesis protein, partial [Enterobacter hormaechei]|nr:IucA/IucC family siderophore biosynthesis protein [Enterobacter hormaechei]
TLSTPSGAAVVAENALLQPAPALEMSDGQTAEYMEHLYAGMRGHLQLLQARETLVDAALIHLAPDALPCLMRGYPMFIFNKVS